MKKTVFYLMIFVASILYVANTKEVGASPVFSGSIEGVYKTDFGEMTLYLNGNHVTGTYKYKGGKIDGILNGKTLTGTWVQENSRGKLEFVFSSDFSSFTGKWGYNESAPSAKWNGTKISGGSNSGNSVSSPVESYSSNSKIAGNYTTDFKDMTLSISGNHVSGTYKHMGGKIDGILQGNKLVGTWTQTNGHGKLVFVFSDDFSSFAGKWGYNDSAPSAKWDGRKVGAQSSNNTDRIQPSAAVDIAGSWYGDQDQRARLNFWQHGDKFTVVICWPDDKAGIWKTDMGEGVIDGRLMKFIPYRSNLKGGSLSSNRMCYFTVSDDNREIIGYTTINGQRIEGESHYYRVK